MEEDNESAIAIRQEMLAYMMNEMEDPQRILTQVHQLEQQFEATANQ